MKTTRHSLHEPVLLLGILCALVAFVSLSGCGGSSGGKQPAASAAASPANGFAPVTGTGRARLTIQWPSLSRAKGRLIPLAANSIVVTLAQHNGATLAQKTLSRPVSGDTTVVDLPNLPLGIADIRAAAFPNADGTGVAQASGSGSVTIVADVLTPITVVMGTTVDHIDVTPAGPLDIQVGATLSGSATARDAAGALVLLSPLKATWTSSNESVASVSATGLITAVGAGTAVLTFLDSESGKSASLQVNVSAPAPLHITTFPELYPAFDPAITDYVLPAATNTSVTFTVDALGNSTVSVDGQPFRSSAFTTQVDNLDAGRQFSFVVKSSSGSKTYYVRRLPADFPLWKTERFGTPQAKYYVFAPNLLSDSRQYVIIADNYGVPLWWYHPDVRPIDAKILPDGNIGWFAYLPNQPKMQFVEERTFDGTLVQTIKPDPADEGVLDTHDFLFLPNGNHLLIVNVNRGPIDLSPYGGSEAGTIINHVLKEFAPDGTLVWQWSLMDHVPLSETSPNWWPFITDPYHINSVEPDGDGYILSLRHLDAVLRIDRATGAITWKLGGTPRSESLAFVGDTLGSFGGQHDARLLPDGTLTVHDNGTGKGRPPRAVRYRIDTVSRTAALVEQVTDSAVQSSGLVGSARKQSGGNWVTAWGGNPYVTELKPDGSAVLRLTFQNAFFTYRAPAVPFGTIQRDRLRSGMDAQFPR